VIDRDLRHRYEFFRDHAGYATPPGRVACALQLARAEREYEARDDVRIDWDWDPDPDTSWADESEHAKFDREEWEILRCVVETFDEDGATVNEVSLYGIVVTGPNDPYCRVVQAELYTELAP